jgi:hypothetical protein
MKAASLFLLVIFLLPCTAVCDESQGFPGVQRIMSPQQFRQMGLDKLTPEQLEMLNKWLIGYTSMERDVVRKETIENESEKIRETVKQEVKLEVTQEVKKEAEEAEHIVSRIDGPFEGWEGKTVFKLKNGQIWQQRISGRIMIKATEPQVEITKNLFGFYVMHVLNTDYAIGVKRIK